MTDCLPSGVLPQEARAEEPGVAMNRLQGYLAHKKTTPPRDPPMTLGIGYGRNLGVEMNRLGVKIGRLAIQQGALIRNRLLLGPYRRAMPRALWWS